MGKSLRLQSDARLAVYKIRLADSFLSTGRAWKPLRTPQSTLVRSKSPCRRSTGRCPLFLVLVHVRALVLGLHGVKELLKLPRRPQPSPSSPWGCLRS